ncbi:MAG: prepilin peptidase [Candidatus Omnitrophica bacterium]|nr:prepilin peptidase [Candidatus Omnitrophota bacterium]
MLVGLFVFVLGSCVGSFLNVCIYRMPREISIVRPFSFCPKCKASIKWYDNIPILGFFLLGGKCRSCKEPISPRYPLVEAITASLFLILYIKFGLSFSLLKYILLFSLLVVVSFIDIDYHALPISLCFIGVSLGVILSLYETIYTITKWGISNLNALPITKSLIGLITGFGFTYAFKFFGDIFISLYLAFRGKESIEGEKESLGLGDVDFMGMVGVFLGAKLTILAFFLAPFLAIFYSIFALIFKRSHIIPYLPYLSLASFLSFMWGDVILNLLKF